MAAVHIECLPATLGLPTSVDLVWHITYGLKRCRRRIHSKLSAQALVCSRAASEHAAPLHPPLLDWHACQVERFMEHGIAL